MDIFMAQRYICRAIISPQQMWLGILKIPKWADMSKVI